MHHSLDVGEQTAHFGQCGFWHVSEGVNRAKEANDLGVLLITHYTRILRYIRPDHVHVFVDGRIVEQGGPELADELEANGYDRYLAQA